MAAAALTPWLSVARNSEPQSAAVTCGTAYLLAVISRVWKPSLPAAAGSTTQVLKCLQSRLPSDLPKERRAIPALVRALADARDCIRFNAAVTLRDLTGETIAWEVLTGDPWPLDQADAVARWRAWWAENGGD